MKVVNRKEFLELENVLYCKYTSLGVCEGVSIKEGTVNYKGKNIDFFYIPLFGSYGLDFFQYCALRPAFDGGEINIPMEFVGERDGLFEEDEKYLIFEKEDIRLAIKALQELV